MAKYSKEAQAKISSKMHVMSKEKKPQDQKVAIAMSYARKAGLKVPKPKAKNPGDLSDFLSHPHIKKSLPR